MPYKKIFWIFYFMDYSSKYKIILKEIFCDYERYGYYQKIFLNFFLLALERSISHYWHIMSSEDVKVDPAKIEGITNVSLPNSVNELQWFLSMIIYLRRLTTNLPEVISLIYALLKKKFKLEIPQLNPVRKLRLQQLHV